MIQDLQNKIFTTTISLIRIFVKIKIKKTLVVVMSAVDWWKSNRHECLPTLYETHVE
jgi:hypothetical protein